MTEIPLPTARKILDVSMSPVVMNREMIVMIPTIIYIVPVVIVKLMAKKIPSMKCVPVVLSQRLQLNP